MHPKSLLAAGAGLVLLGLAHPAHGLILSEFVAANADGLLDGDGDASDWIEIFNPSSAPASAAGWRLTDDPNDPAKWTLPDVVVPGHGFLVVFASGKDRADPGGELHANFALARDGEYLALGRPDGEVATEFAPAFPPQRAGLSYGLSLEIAESPLLAGDAPGRTLVPADGSLGTAWTAPGFTDDAWTPVTQGIGYDHAGPGEGGGGGDPVRADASRPGDLVVATSTNSPAGEEVDKATDDSSSTKYLNFDKLHAGFTVTFGRGAAAVDGLRFTSANDAPERDPTGFVLSGSNDGSGFTEVASGAVPDFTARFQTVAVDFANAISYAHYRLVFPTVRDAAAAVAVQIAEVEFLALIDDAPPPDDGEDVTVPGDLIVATSSNSPGGEEVDKAIDDTSATKYLNFDKTNAGFTVTPSAGASVVTGLRLTSANDAPDRDPTSFALAGSLDGTGFTPIASGAVPDFTARFQPVEVSFANNTPYAHYRLVFPTVRDAAAAVAVQIAEVEFLGLTGDAAARFDELIGTDIGDTLAGAGNGAYLRLPFTVPGGDLPALPALRVWSDDGFVAFLNGVEIARANTPPAVSWNSLATEDRPRADALRGQRFDLAPFAHHFNEGGNVLALHGLNDSADSGEFLLRAEVFDTEVQLGGAARFEHPTPGAANPGGLGGIVENPVASVGRGFFTAPFTLELATPTGAAEIRYTTDGSEPTATTGDRYTAPLTIGRTTVLRAAAFRAAWLASETVTHTYLFAADVPGQTHAAALAAGLPPSWNGQPADYGMDRRVAVEPDELLTIPSVSIALDPEEVFGATGIYANPNSRGDNWEREISFEWLDPAGGETFQEGAGLRIQGGAFRRFDLTLKKSFRLVFRERYGAPKLRRSIFGPAAAEEADNIVLRANGNDAWKWGGAATQYIRDAFAMESMRAMGNVASHSTFAHLYINGQYWGLYNPTERPDAAFSSTYHGGATGSWDALNQDSVPDGTADAWNRLIAACNAGLAGDASYQRIQGNNPDGTRNPAYEVLLDVDNLIDYMIMNLYIGNVDWPHRNHWYGINRDGQEGFQFYPWDSETALGLGSNLDTDRTGVDSSVARPYAALRANREFRLRFADRVQRHFFNGGAFHAGGPAARYAALAESVEAAVAGESARWGDQMGGSLFTRERHWRPERDDLLANYFPRRAAVVLSQFRAAGLYPAVDAPVFGQHGGTVPEGFALSMTAGAGTIHYTTDGSDPRTGQTYAAPVPLEDLVTVRARSRNGGVWSALTEATFVVGTPRLAIAELDYHPAPPTATESAAGFGDGDDFEFVELFNPSGFSFDLRGVRFVDGVEFDFTGSAAETLPPGGRVLVVNRADAFAARHGGGLPVAGEYSGRFANEGERVEVVGADGSTLISFTYSDSGPWPVSADGGGRSLELRDADADPENAANWSASAGAPTPGDAPGIRPARNFAISRDGGELRFVFEADPGVRYTLVESGSLAPPWVPAAELAARDDAGPAEFRIPHPPGSTPRFFRIVGE